MQKVENFVIASFDPASTRNLGWAVATLDTEQPTPKSTVIKWACGTFVLPFIEERWKVLWPIFAISESFLSDIDPNVVVIEKTSSFAGGFVTGQVSNCMGVIYAVCGKLECNLEFVYPTTVKKTVAGHGRAKKGAVKKAVNILLERIGVGKVVFDSEHAADASANILYWLIKQEIIKPLGEKNA